MIRNDLHTNIKNFSLQLNDVVTLPEKTNSTKITSECDELGKVR